VFVFLCYYFNFLSIQLALQEFMLFALGVALVSLIGYWDDHQNLSAKFRLLAQFIVASGTVMLLHRSMPEHLSLVVWKGFEIPFRDLWLILPIIGIVWSINLFNFMDGLDGLASLEAIFVLGMGGVFLWHPEISGSEAFSNSNWPSAFSSLAFGMTFLVLGFLIWNWPRAFVFMGDVGSYGLGFLIALFTLLGNLYYSIPIVVWLIVYAVFWFDATVTLIRRMIMGKAFMSAHCEHAYQRLHQAGFTSKQVLIWIMILNSILAVLGWWVYQDESNTVIGIIFAMLLLISSYGMVEYLKPMKNTKKEDLCETV
jgi:Fuc2NAc and GlcNAc transferase